LTEPIHSKTEFIIIGPPVKDIEIPVQTVNTLFR